VGIRISSDARNLNADAKQFVNVAKEIEVEE
jgi:hypothetical protein